MPLPDTRLLELGLEIPTATYSDQPFIVQTDDGAWLCIVTTGSGHEGEPGQHVVVRRSIDHGQSWGEAVALESAAGPEASYAVMLKVESGRIYAFYNYNIDNLRQVRADDPPFTGGYCSRVDSLGAFVFRYSDDHGRSWSADRHLIPMREFAIDRQNPYGGEVRFGWNVGKPFILDGAAYISFHKVGGFGYEFFTSSEGVLLRCEEILHDADPASFSWETLPDGDIGLRTPPGGGPVSEEHSYVVLSDGSIYVIYRTVDGHPTTSVSRDGGHHWREPRYLRYADGRLVKHPRAANFVWKTRAGRYLYWFHNHGGKGYEDRNPAWLCGGVEVDTPEGRDIAWSQPEILLYDDDTFIRMSYPDLVESPDGFYISETQKDTARMHAIDPTLLTGLWGQLDASLAAPLPNDHAVHLAAPDGLNGQICDVRLPDFIVRDYTRADYGTKETRDGFTLQLRFVLSTLRPNQTLVHNHHSTNDIGLRVHTVDGGAFALTMNDARSEQVWRSDRGVLVTGEEQHLCIIVDGGPRVILYVLNGRLLDGGTERQFGWGRFARDFRGATGMPTLTLAPDMDGRVTAFSVFTRALRVSEAIRLSRG